MDANDLQDRIVLVHPELISDPANRQSQAGRIESADLDSDTFQVKFLDGGSALYASDALLVLKDAEAIFQRLEAGSKDFKDAAIRHSYGAAGILHIGFGAADRSVMNSAIKHPEMHEICLESLSDVLERRQNLYLDR